MSRIVVVGASQGGIQALHSLIGGLPQTFAPPIFIVQHIGASESILPAILNQADGNKAAFHAGITLREIQERAAAFDPIRRA